MDLLTWVFLESTAALGTVIGLTLFFLLVYWRRTLRPRPLLIGMSISVVLLVVQAIVVTQREAAQAILDPIAADLCLNRTSVLDRSIAQDFRTDDLDRGAFLGLVRRMLDRVQIHTARCTAIQTTSAAADRFEAVATYSSNLTTPAMGQGTITSTWRFQFIRMDGRWKIARIDPVQILTMKMRDWNQIEAMR